jgi:hypothetical protein
MTVFNLAGAEISCSVRQVYGIGGVKDRANTLLGLQSAGKMFLNTIRKLIPAEGKGSRAFIFSDRVDPSDSGGNLIAKFLRKHNLGSVTESPTYINGNYGHAGSELKIWIFIPDSVAVDRFYADEVKLNRTLTKE